ncbi:DUF1534 domain-containing protein [Pseudomonas tremae]|nr:DUF1534 domain-containing protein [Pseudomonas tremae]MCF5806802.1 DUF1534 domain-containing protein [Pseudomonas tremae]
MPTQSLGTIFSVCSLLTLQRRNAVRDALRHTTHPRCSQFFTPHPIPLPHCLPYYCATLAPSAQAGTILVLSLVKQVVPMS